MLVISLEGTYQIEQDGGGRIVERPCAVPRYDATGAVPATESRSARTR